MRCPRFWITWIILTIQLSVLLFISPLGNTAIVVETNSSTSGVSQIFFAGQDGIYSEERSQTQVLETGDNNLAFDFGLQSETLVNSLRWDPSDSPGKFEIESISLEGIFGRERVPFSSLRANIAASEVRVDPDSAYLETFSNDGQFLLSIDLIRFYWVHILRIIIVGSLMGLVCAALLLRVTKRTVTSGN